MILGSYSVLPIGRNISSIAHNVDERTVADRQQTLAARLVHTSDDGTQPGLIMTNAPANDLNMDTMLKGERTECSSARCLTPKGWVTRAAPLRGAHTASPHGM